MELLLAVLLGAFFGFALQRVGASNPENIINMLRLRDLHLMKAILFAIGFSSLVLFLGLRFGFIEAGHLSVKSAHWGVLAGGAVLGIGFAVGGYCPGTSLVGIGEGRRDAWFFTVGGLLGALLFMMVFPVVEETGILKSLWGGKVSLAETGNASTTSLLGDWVAFVVAAVFILVAFLLPSAPAKKAGGWGKPRTPLA